MTINSPILVKPLPSQIVLEGSEFTAFDFSDYIISSDEESGDPVFSAALSNNNPLPKGLHFTTNGVLSGTPEVGTYGDYEIQITAKNAADTPLIVKFDLTIVERIIPKENQPILVKIIPPIVINEGAALGPIHLTEYIKSSVPDAAQPLHFTAEIKGGAALPLGVICTSNGILSGIPASGTIGHFDIHLLVENTENQTKLETSFELIIKERISIGESSTFYTGLKSQVWDALGKNQPVPAFEDLFKHQLTAIEIYYLMQRFATLSIYDVYNLEPPGQPILLTLPGASPHYNIYDRGSCLVGTPKELFSHERTLEDALITAKIMAREVYKRGWTVELVGFQKMMRATWVELQVLGKKHGNLLDILHYVPTANDLKLYESELQTGMPLGKNL